MTRMPTGLKVLPVTSLLEVTSGGAVLAVASIGRCL